MRNELWRAAVEIGFIVFLFYSNLLMGEFTGSAPGRTRGLLWALRDVISVPNLAIALVAAAIGYGIVEYLRRRL